MYKMYLYLLVNTFCMVSNTQNKSSENLNFHPILGINYTQCGENAATKGISCDSIYFAMNMALVADMALNLQHSLTVILYITYHGIDDWVFQHINLNTLHVLSLIS